MSNGKENGKWKNGTCVNFVNAYGAKSPYIRICAGPCRGKYVHQLVAEAKIGRPLKPNETVEHADGNGLNPHPQNLTVVTKADNIRARYARESKRVEIASPS